MTANTGSRAPEDLSWSGARLAAEYLRRLADQGVPVSELTAAADASEDLAVGYRDRFLARPVFLGAGELHDLMADLRTVHRLLTSLPDRLFGGSHERFVRSVGMTAVQETVTARAFGGSVPSLSRADLYRSASGFKLLESNITSSLGGFENADMNRAMLAHPALARFAAEYDLTYVDTLRAMVATMLSECGGLIRGERPVVALVDWPDSFVDYEPRLRMLASLLDGMGIDAIPCHIGQLRERDGALEVGGRTVDIVYRFFVLKEIATEADAAALEPLLAAAERGTVAVFTPIGADAYMAKSALAMLSDDRNRQVFSAEESACIDRILPWTRHLRRVGTDPDGREVDLPAYAVAHQGDLLLKPALDYGGAGVVPGWTVTPEEWAARLAGFEDTGYILQERVRPVAEPFPRGDGTGTEDVYINWGVFLVDPKATHSEGYGGCLLRGTTDPDAGIVSLGSGARVGCCFHVAGPAL